jgi:tRNA threonylcarbamoyladenosine biosynthesis protein TsaE
MSFDLPDEAATLAMARIMGACLPSRLIVFLEGQLGAGKTTLVRGLIQSLGYTGKVKSPTYGLVERYELPDRLIHHLDLYRLGHPEELEFMGIRDIIDEPGIVAIEWPERGQGMLPQADVSCHLEVLGQGRELQLVAASEAGHSWVDCVDRRHLVEKTNST